MPISAKDVKALREQTGAGMMDCKKALAEADGSVEKAIEVLRERGLAKAGKRAGRETGEGSVGIALVGSAAGIIELGCETDFVAKTDDFQSLARSIAELVAGDASRGSVDSTLAASLAGSTVQETIQAAVAKLGENVELKRVERIEAAPGVAGGYVHAGGKLGVVVALATAEGGDAIEALAKDVSMHVAAVDPTPIAIDRDGVPSDTIDNERRILRNEALASGKPEKIVDKIVDGRIGKFYSEHCLLEQPFVKDPDVTVGDLLKKAGSDVSIRSFVRFKLGEANSG